METLIEYRNQIRAWREQWLLYVTTGSQEALRSVARHPQAPRYEGAPPPPIVWMYRHPDTQEGDSYDWYSFLHHRVFSVGGRNFRRGSGRYEAGRVSRNGRLDWPATQDAVREWQVADHTAQALWEAKIREIQNEEFQRVLTQAPGHEFTFGPSQTPGKVVPMPDGDYLICEHGKLWVMDTRVSIAQLREDYPQGSFTEKWEKSRLDAPRRLKKCLGAYYSPWCWVGEGMLL